MSETYRQKVEEPHAGRAERDLRRAQALRENLRRRKTPPRERTDDETAP